MQPDGNGKGTVAVWLHVTLNTDASRAFGGMKVVRVTGPRLAGRDKPSEATVSFPLPRSVYPAPPTDGESLAGNDSSSASSSSSSRWRFSASSGCLFR